MEVALLGYESFGDSKKRLTLLFALLACLITPAFAAQTTAGISPRL
jgi:hypothetical protein